MSFVAAVTELRLDVHKGIPTGLRSVPNSVQMQAVSSGAAVSFTVPSGATKCILSADVNVFVNCYGTASSSNATDGSGSEINPEGYIFDVQGNGTPTAISVLGEASGHCSIAFYN